MKTCREVMTENPVCCTAGDTADRIAKLMRSEDIGSVPIVDSSAGRRLVGIVTDRDLAIQVVAEGRDPARIRAEEVMTRNPITCRPEDDLAGALDAMERQQVRRIPVVARDGKLVGIIAQADVATRAGEPEKTAEVVEEISRPSTMRAG